ncbi:type I-E CRISPR-associated endoribonuclease Cas2e [Streptomyces xinghaiensis]|uniref:type I-E CRISPR-associated endoribonuclease Cas2e n=1 Tax=Streptomyces xinghaiensis TaxID=1038928 RepID=UPI0002D31311|nr:type I-E CRISPR-associated endoribonuclease Cas2e [Streptomyces xinghaiensis]MZE76791.1 type I-E CRISPR-associated endoribonuclease Cas2 [Streptomyces sp. SID5475]
MSSMIVISATAIPDHLRGALSRWLLEVTPELYVGTVSARVRDELWTSVAACAGDGMAVLAHPDDNEQGFTLRTAGTRRREPMDFDGLTLIGFRRESQEMANRL